MGAYRHFGRNFCDGSTSSTGALDAPLTDSTQSVLSEHFKYSSCKGPLVIGFGGPSGSGKTTFCTNIANELRRRGMKVSLISCDSYYKSLPHDADPEKYNFDDPNAVEFSLLALHLANLKSGKAVNVPVYCFKSHSRTKRKELVHNVDIVLVEGIFALCDKDVRLEMDIKVYVKEDLDVCLARRTIRDITERGREASNVMIRYTTFVKPAFDRWINPSSFFADVIIPNAGRNACATDLLIRTALSFRANLDGKTVQEDAEKEGACAKEESAA